MTVGTPAAVSSFVGYARFPGRALSAGAADVRQPMRGLNLLLRFVGGTRRILGKEEGEVGGWKRAGLEEGLLSGEER